jgi:N-methylhydantoinase A
VVRVGVDVGGTFTDIFVQDQETGEAWSAKVLTTPENQAIGVTQSVDAAGVDLRTVAFIAHGTTTGTNALIERKGAPTGLIATEGFRDVLEIMRTDRETGYDLTWEKPRPLVPRRLRCDVRERVLKTGEVEVPLDEEQTRETLRELARVGVESIAVSFIHSYANPVHERRVRELAGEEVPDVFISLSSEINAEYREFERTSTVVIDAYIKPIMVRYIQRLVDDLRARGLEEPLFIMQGSGGMITAERATEKPIATLSSGPAAGAIAAAKIGAQAGLVDIVTFDVGGTSTDVSLIHGGQPYVNHQKQVEWGRPTRVPMIDVESVGAGGGSIAWIDEGGGLKVGPQSAGANPGPVCYGRGGTQPTLSDALVVKGVLGAELAGGRVHLDRDAAGSAIEQLAARLGLELDRVVEGIVEITLHNMANAARSVSIWKGLDPRDLTLVAYGGAGGMVAGAVARELDIPRVLIPIYPGNTCAMGLLMTDMQEDASIAFLARANEIDLDILNQRLRDLDKRVRDTLEAQGIARDRITCRHFAAVRYHGQIHELNIPFESYPVREETLAGTFETFEQMYEDIYTIRLEGGLPESVSLGVTGVGELPQYLLAAAKVVGEPEPIGSRTVLEEGIWQSVPVCSRYTLPVGWEAAGPAIIEEPGSTIWVASDMNAEVDPYGNLLITTNVTAEQQHELSTLKEEV